MRKYPSSDKNTDMMVYGIENKNFEDTSRNFQNTTIQIEEQEIKNISNDFEKDQKSPNFKFLIIDCSPIGFIDSVGVKTIKQVYFKNKMMKNFQIFKKKAYIRL